VSISATTAQVPTITSITTYIVVCALFAAAAIVLIAVPLVVRARKPRPKAPTSRHSAARTPEKWRDDVAEVLRKYHAKEISENDAYANLARIARAFASLRLGTDLSAKTLMDLNLHHQVGNKAHFDTLKQTISALYPPEFASASNRSARESSVESAASWVDSMIERWVA
jgi:hypothetical protein